MPNVSPLLGRKKLLGVAVETDWGTAETIAAATAMIVYDAKLVPVDMFSAGQRQPHGHYLGNVAAVKGQQLGTLTFRQELYYGDAFTTLIQGAGYYNNSGTYQPTTNMANFETLSFKIFEDGRYKTLSGAVGTCTIGGESGARVFANWTFTGTLGALGDVAMPAQSPVTAAPYRTMGSTLTIATAAIPYTGSFSIDLGVTVAPRLDITNAAGVIHHFVSSRNPSITLDPEARTVAGGASYAALFAGTEAAVSLQVVDATGNSLTIAAPKAQRISIDESDRGGVLCDTMKLQCNASTGDDELTFTPDSA